MSQASGLARAEACPHYKMTTLRRLHSKLYVNDLGITLAFAEIPCS